MPGFDQTGPTGQGPMTGRGMGFCSWGYGRGFGRRAGRGLGRLFGGFWGFPSQPTKKQQQEDLTEYKKALQEELKMVEEAEADLA
ncbi:DUF5320 domain-containing protein [Candidatus Beckwithbacteria bacterium]|nr:DUF5320 domain-containing protein [Candidatus Beckwithbacteria bacterium]